jgi:hypothetical protein
MEENESLGRLRLATGRPGLSPIPVRHLNAARRQRRRVRRQQVGIRQYSGWTSLGLIAGIGDMLSFMVIAVESVFADGKGFHGHRPGVFYHRQIGLVRARCRNQVGHFLVNIDVGRGNHAVAVGIGIARVINFALAERCPFQCAPPGPAGICTAAIAASSPVARRRFKHHHLALIRLAVHAVRGVRVGDVFGNDIQPRLLGVKAADVF